MVYSFMKRKLILFKISPPFCSGRVSPSNIQSSLQKIISRTCLTRFHPASAVSLFGSGRVHPHGFMVGTSRFYHSNPSLQTQRISRVFLRVSQRAKQPLGRAFLLATSRKWTAGEVVSTVILGSCLCFFIFAGKIERVPYSNRFHFALSDKWEKKLSEYQWEAFEKKNKEKILLQSDPSVIRVESIARKILEAMNKGLMLQHQYQIIHAQTSETSRLMLNHHSAPNFGANKDLAVIVDGTGQEIIQPSQNRNRNLLWKPYTKHLDGKVWDVYVKDSNVKNACCLIGGKIVINNELLHSLKSDAEVATVIGHEIGHAVARHIAEGLMRFSVMWLVMFILFLLFVLVAGDQDKGKTSKELTDLMRLVHSFFSRRREAEADYIGLMLMASAGYDPQVAPAVYENLGGKKTDRYSTHYSGEKRAKLLKKPKTMEQARQIFEEVKAGYGVRSFV